MIAVRVKDGTGAGRRLVKPFWMWRCDCGPVTEGGFSGFRTHPSDRYSCPDCGARRPKL